MPLDLVVLLDLVHSVWDELSLLPLTLDPVERYGLVQPAVSFVQ